MSLGSLDLVVSGFFVSPACLLSNSLVPTQPLGARVRAENGGLVGDLNRVREWQWSLPVPAERQKVPTLAHRLFSSTALSTVTPKCGAQDTFYVGNLKGVGRVYQQTFIDTYAKVACAKLYDRKTPVTAADLLNDRVIPFFDSHDVKLLRVLTDRGSEYCGNPERHGEAHGLSLIPSTPMELENWLRDCF